MTPDDIKLLETVKAQRERKRAYNREYYRRIREGYLQFSQGQASGNDKAE